MSKVSAALLLTLTINMFLFFGNTAVQEINPTQNFYNVEGSQLGSRLSSTGTFNDSNISGDLPATTSSVSAETGVTLIDVPASFIFWLQNKVNMLWGIVTAVPDFLEAIHLPTALVGGLSALWYIYITFLILSFFWGDRS